MSTPSAARFDWYQATFDGLDEDRVVSALVLAFGGSVTLGRGQNGYSRSATVEVDDRVIATVYSGSARVGEVHVKVTGGACDDVVPLLRRLWPVHRVSRVDVALDFAASFEELDARALEFAKKLGLSYRLVTSSDGGATRYLGSVKSEVMVRVYKKSEELRAKHPDQASEIPDGIVRAEIQVRPASRVKGHVATMSPVEVWGLGSWAPKFAAQFLDLAPVAVPTHFRKASDWSRSLHWLGQQYAPTIARRIEQVGEDQAREEVLAVLGLGLGEHAPF